MMLPLVQMLFICLCEMHFISLCEIHFICLCDIYCICLCEMHCICLCEMHFICLCEMHCICLWDATTGADAMLYLQAVDPTVEPASTFLYTYPLICCCDRSHAPPVYNSSSKLNFLLL